MGSRRLRILEARPGGSALRRAVVTLTPCPSGPEPVFIDDQVDGIVAILGDVRQRAVPDTTVPDTTVTDSGLRVGCS